MRVQLRLDYATMNFKSGEMSISRVSELLAGSYDVFCWKRSGISDGAPAYSPLGLRYMENSGFSERPHKVQISGVGCEKFAPTLPALRGAAENHLSRVDFAFDVVMTRTEWRRFLTDCFASSMESERQRKRYRLTGDGEAMTVYMGTRKGAKYFRIYNKTLEDKHYTYYDGDGKIVPLDPETECVIRYEVELHHWRSTEKTRVREYDPSPAFDWYYSDDPADWQRLHDEIRKLWLSFGNDILLPSGFSDIEFVNRLVCNKSEILFNKSDAEKLDVVKEKLHDYPRSFESSLQFVVERYGRYIPYILMDSAYREQCSRECERVFGFVPDYYFESAKPSGWYDDDPLEDPDGALPWLETAAEEQLSIDEDFDEGRKYPWL